MRSQPCSTAPTRPPMPVLRSPVEPAFAFARSASAVGSPGRGRKAARPMLRLGRVDPFDPWRSNGRFRRILLKKSVEGGSRLGFRSAWGQMRGRGPWIGQRGDGRASLFVSFASKIGFRPITCCGRSTGFWTSARCGKDWRRSTAASIDPELMIRMLIVGYCLGIRSERRLCEEVHLESGLPLVSLGGHGLSTPLFSAGQVGSARKGSGFFACSTPGGVGGQDGLRRIERPSSASRSAGKCRTVATSDAGSSDPRPLPGAPFRLVGGTRVVRLCACLA